MGSERRKQTWLYMYFEGIFGRIWWLNAYGRQNAYGTCVDNSNISRELDNVEKADWVDNEFGFKYIMSGVFVEHIIVMFSMWVATSV